MSTVAREEDAAVYSHSRLAKRRKPRARPEYEIQPINTTFYIKCKVFLPLFTLC